MIRRSVFAVFLVCMAASAYAAGEKAKADNDQDDPFGRKVSDRIGPYLGPFLPAPLRFSTEAEGRDARKQQEAWMREEEAWKKQYQCLTVDEQVAKANRHLAAAGLSQFAQIRAGDALQTLRDVGGSVDLLFLDGWKLMYPDVLKLLMPSLRQGSVVLADDVTLFPDDVASYLDFVRDPANGLVTATLPLGDGIEYSVKL